MRLFLDVNDIFPADFCRLFDRVVRETRVATPVKACDIVLKAAGA